MDAIAMINQILDDMVFIWIGHVTLVAIPGTTILVPYFEVKPLQCNSFEDCTALIRFYQECEIIKWEAETLLHERIAS